MSNFFETLKPVNRSENSRDDFFSSQTPADEQETKPSRRIVETDSPSVRKVCSTTVPPETSIGHSPSLNAGLGSGVGTGGVTAPTSMNFFSDPEIKLKMKKADGIPTMTEFHSKIAKPLAMRWKTFGLAIGFNEGSLEAIEQKYSSLKPDVPQFFNELFRNWEKVKSEAHIMPCNWSVIVNVLRNSLQEYEIADTIAKKFNIVEIADTITKKVVEKDGGGDNQSLQSEGYGSLPPSLNQHVLLSAGDSSQPNSLSDSSSQRDMSSIHLSKRNHTVLPSPDVPCVPSPSLSSCSDDHQPSSLQAVSNERMLSPSDQLLSLPHSMNSDQLYIDGSVIPRGSLPIPLSTAASQPTPSTSYSNSNIHHQVSSGNSYYPPHQQLSSQPNFGFTPISGPNPPYNQFGYNAPHVGGAMSVGVSGIDNSRPGSGINDRSGSIDRIYGESRDNSSESTYHSAVESTTTRKYNDASLTELLQRYMKELENTQDGRNQSVEKLFPTVAPIQKPDEKEENESLLKKELEKAYERISSLEVRIQDLTMQSNIEIPEDHEVSYMQKEKLEQEFRRMREFKRQAEKQNMEAKQTTQRLVAENSRLKEELALVKNDREMIVNQLKREIRKAKERDDHSKEKLEVSARELKEKIAKRYEVMTSMSIPKREQLMKVSDFPPLSITPQEFSKILNTQKTNVSLGLVLFTGLPACGKTTLLKSLLQKENSGKPLKVRGEETCLQVHELLITKNPLTEETNWSPAPGLESAVQLLSTIVAQYCFRQKSLPTFPSVESLEKEAKSIPFLQDKDVQQHFVRVYKAVKGLIEEKSKNDSLSELALFHPTFLNVWDAGVNRSLYQYLSSCASQINRLVTIVFLDLERDVPRLDSPPDLNGKKLYSQRSDDKFVMKTDSRLRCLLLLAGLKRWYVKSSTNDEAPEAMIVGVHTKEFSALNGGKKFKESVDLLQRAVLAEAEKMNISSVIVPKITTFCTDAIDQHSELNKVKMKIEELFRAQPKCDTVFDAKSMFLRSMMYGEEKPMFFKRGELSKLASRCGIYFEDELNDFLADCRDTGSLVFYPKVVNQFLHDKIVLDVVKPLKLLDRLYYLPMGPESKGSETLSTEDLEQYQHGMVSKKLLTKLFKEVDVDSFLAYLSNSEVCVDISLSDQQEKYFFPSIRTFAVNRSSPNAFSLFITHSSEFIHSACLTLYVKFLKLFFQVPSEALLSHTKEFNSVVIKIYETPSSKPVEVLIVRHLKERFVEVRIPDLENHARLSLCSKLTRLSHMVFQYLSEHFQYLNFQLCVKCPYNESHMAQFFLKYHKEDVYCKACKKSFHITDNRLCWLS